jgi:hypothetical protein
MAKSEGKDVRDLEMSLAEFRNIISKTSRSKQIYNND